MNTHSPIDTHTLQQAAEWLMRMNEGALNAQELAQWQHWRSSNTECERAWQRAERLLAKVGQLPAPLAMPALDRPANPQRRVALGRLAALLAMSPLAWVAWETNQRQGWTADYRAAVGERRDIVLADSSQLILNTDTALDVRFDTTQRLIVLRHGEIMLRAAADSFVPARHLSVATPQGQVTALGSRFNLRIYEARTRVVVLDGAVRINLASAANTVPVTVQASQSIDFNAWSIAEPQPADSSLSAWTRGMLMADNMRLGDFLAELGRYGHGFIRCDPGVAELRISGAFPVDDRSRTLRMLALTYPVKVASHLDGFWVLLSPA